MHAEWLPLVLWPGVKRHIDGDSTKGIEELREAKVIPNLYNQHHFIGICWNWILLFRLFKCSYSLLEGQWYKKKVSEHGISLKCIHETYQCNPSRYQFRLVWSKVLMWHISLCCSWNFQVFVTWRIQSHSVPSPLLGDPKQGWNTGQFHHWTINDLTEWWTSIVLTCLYHLSLL